LPPHCCNTFAAILAAHNLRSLQEHVEKVPLSLEN
jgi:hypothetical protein